MSARKMTNEPEFQGQVIVWLNEEIAKRPGISVEKATQEKPRSSSGKRSDLIIWFDRLSESAFLTLELKTPATYINDATFFTDAIEKARHWNAPYFALWNMQELEVYATPPTGQAVLPTNAIARSSLSPAITQVEHWLRPVFTKELRTKAIDILNTAWEHYTKGSIAGHAIDSEIFVNRLTTTIHQIREILHRDLTKATATDRKLRRTMNRIAAEQGFKDFVEDIEYAVAGQIGYRFVGQILFYFALKRKIPTLKELKLSAGDVLPSAFQQYWNDVRRYDYEALFKPEPIDSIIPIAEEATRLIAHLTDDLATYDWASLTDDVLGSIFEHMIPREEQILLGQFYTSRTVADLLVAFTVDGERPLVLDPGCGSGTFLMSAYSYLAHKIALSHKELLSTIWGFDISPFAAELAVINMYRQDMSEFENFPRIVPGNFFDRFPGDSVEFPAPHISAGTKKIPIPIPRFNCIVGNPPYLRSQNQDDLDPTYRSQLFISAAKAGIKASSKTDLFAFFIYHSMQFMDLGSRIGFVTPASWLTTNYARPLQEMLLGEIRLSLVLASTVESFFPQVDVNTVRLVAEKVDQKAKDEPIRFVTLKHPISELTAGSKPYWTRIVELVDEIEAFNVSVENNRYRIKCVDPSKERAVMSTQTKTVLNWSKYIRAPISYYEIFEGDVRCSPL